MGGSSPVTILRDYCAQKKIGQPKYKWTQTEYDGFVCRTEIMGVMSQGSGQTRRDAQYQTATKAMNILRTKSINEFPQTPSETTPVVDIIAILRHYCEQNNYPLPIFNIVHKGGTQEVPEFTAVCRIGIIKRYAFSLNKKDSKKNAACEMMHSINNDKTLMEALQYEKGDDEEGRFLKFKSYRDISQCKGNDVRGVLLCDRHNHFNKNYEHVKNKARCILKTPYESPKTHALAVFEVLKLEPRTTRLDTNDMIDAMIFIEFNCEYDVVFAGLESKVYTNVLQYFRDML